MKNKFLFVVVGTLLMAFSGCKEDKKTRISNLEISNLDNSVAPCDDFFQYACGGWMKNNPLKSEYSRYGTFDKLGEENQKQVHELIEGLAAKQEQAGSDAQKIGDLYKIGMDSAKLNREQAGPIELLLGAISKMTDKEVLKAEIAKLHRNGTSPFFFLYIGADETNSDMNIVNLYQGGLGMPDRDYYLQEDESNMTIRNAYVNHIQSMFQLTGYSKEASEAASQAVMKIETALAKASYSRVELRDSYKNYNKMTVSDLHKIAPSFDWKSYFSAIGLAEQETLNVGQVPFFESFGTILNEANIDEIKAYYLWNIIHDAAPYLSDDFRIQNFDFYGKTLSGAEEMRPRWKYVVRTVEGALGEAVGQIYVKTYFSPESKERILTMVTNLQAALYDRIQGLEWMTDETKEKAFEKLATFHVKIGYPDKWRDYSGLEIKNDSYWANIQRSNVFDFDYMISKAGQPVDKEEWGMTPQTVNAYYNPTTNEICFPAGILQPPFFYPQADDALNYGAIGVVIGHEMTHGFDDQGRNYDKDGNLNDWWTSEDSERFDKRAQALVDYFDQIIVTGDVHANGQLTLGENIADQGGILLSYAALQKELQDKKTDKIDEFTPEQRFFLAYANVWANNIREQEILRLTNQDPHSLGRWRVNGTLPHLQQFIDAFDIKEGTAMFLPVEKRCLVW